MPTYFPDKANPNEGITIEDDEKVVLPGDLAAYKETLYDRYKEGHDHKGGPDEGCQGCAEYVAEVKVSPEMQEAYAQKLETMSNACVKELEDLFNETWIPSPEEEARAKEIIHSYLLRI